MMLIVISFFEIIFAGFEPRASSVNFFGINGFLYYRVSGRGMCVFAFGLGLGQLLCIVNPFTDAILGISFLIYAICRIRYIFLV